MSDGRSGGEFLLPFGWDGEERDEPPTRSGDALRASEVPPSTTLVDNSGGAYATEGWEARYFSADERGGLHEHRIVVRVPAGLAGACPPVPVGQPGCVYGVRRWGLMLRPSALESAGFDPTPLLTTGQDTEVLRAILHAATFELPGEFILASPEHPFHLIAPDGRLRGSSVNWRTYLGALSYYVSGGRVDASFIRFWAESHDSYQQAVQFCLEALREP